jgi:hypothetical protein
VAQVLHHLTNLNVRHFGMDGIGAILNGIPTEFHKTLTIGSEADS